VDPRASYREFEGLAHRLADAAGLVQRRYFRTPVAVDVKADSSPVTVADREAEAAMRELIRTAYPDHGILGEEHGRERLDAEFVWVLDPIDGTKSFITGRPLFGTLIALAHAGRPVLGIIDQSILAERWLGPGGGGGVVERPPRPHPRLRSIGRRHHVLHQSPHVRDTRPSGPASPRSSRPSGCRCTAATATPTACWRPASPTSSSRPACAPYDYMALVPVVEGARRPDHRLARRVARLRLAGPSCRGGRPAPPRRGAGQAHVDPPDP
jgi:inositol-phosphate phosphatase/L-galactose 1-phosphate phosphatase/histidinol-phosphatase